MNCTLQIPYGKQTLTFRLPEENLAAVLAPNPVPALPDPDRQIASVLDHPLDTPPLSKLVYPGEQVLILVDDYTRATPAAQILPHFLERIHAAGVPVEDITFLVSTGTHRASTPEELIQKVGSDIYARYRIEQHDCTDEDSQAYFGLTGRGTPVWINRLVLEADRIFGIGHIDPSDYAGYSGGHKLIVPGIASLETVNANHSMATLSLQHGCTDLPCRQDLEEAGAMVPVDLFLNVVLCQDGQLAGVFAGSPAQVYQEGVRLAKKVYEVECPEMVDLAIASGYPYDIDYYQAIRAIEMADDIVREGGAILLVAPCPDGVGSDEFYRLLADPGKQPDDFLRDIARRNGKVTYNVLGYFMSMIKAHKKLYAYAEGLTRAELAAIGIEKLDDLQAGIDQLLAACGSPTRAAVLPAGSATIPQLRDGR